MSDQSTLDVGVEPECSPDEANRSSTSSEDGGEIPSVTEAEDDEVHYPGGDTRTCTYVYHVSVCEDHPDPDRPGTSNHHRASVVSIDGDSDAEETALEAMTPETCSNCDADVTSTTLRGEWPLDDLTTEAILELFRETNGKIVIEFYPGSWDKRFYIGEVDGRYQVETDEYGRPDLPTGADDLPDLVREHPNRLSSIDGTSLEGMYEDYINGTR